MSADVSIDTEEYEHRFGKPAGRAFWSFRIVSADPAIRDHVFTTRKPVIFKEACREARELARMRRSEKIILVPPRATALAHRHPRQRGANASIGRLRPEG